MTEPPHPPGPQWLLTDFVRRVPGVEHAAAVSAEGLLLAASEGLARDQADQLSAVTSGLISLTSGAARCFDTGEVSQTVVEMERGYLFVMSIGAGACLATLAGSTCDIGVVAYEMTLLAADLEERLDLRPA